jgi:hypothetical protein
VLDHVPSVAQRLISEVFGEERFELRLGYDRAVLILTGESVIGVGRARCDNLVIGSDAQVRFVTGGGENIQLVIALSETLVEIRLYDGRAIAL